MTTKNYETPDVNIVIIESTMVVAMSPTGEQFTEPEEYGGF